MAYQFGGGSYGGVYRPAPNIAQQSVGPPKVQIGPPPVAFPKLGQWPPGSRPDTATPAVQAYWTWRAGVPFIPVGAPAAIFPALGQWPRQYFQPEAPLVALAQRLPKVPEVILVAGIAYPMPWAWMALHLPAFLRDWPIPLLTQRLELLGVGDPPVSFTLAGLPTRYYATDPPLVALAQRLPVTPAVLVIGGIAYLMPWAVMAQHGPAFLRDYPLVALDQRLPLTGIGAPPVAFPTLGAWTAGTMDPPDASKQFAQFRLRLQPIGDPAVPFGPRPTWNAVTPPPLVWAPYGQRRVVVILAAVLFPVRGEDFSGPRFLAVDASGARYEAVDLGGGRYLLTDESGQRFLGVDFSGPRMGGKDVS